MLPQYPNFVLSYRNVKQGKSFGEEYDVLRILLLLQGVVMNHYEFIREPEHTNLGASSNSYLNVSLIMESKLMRGQIRHFYANVLI